MSILDWYILIYMPAPRRKSMLEHASLSRSCFLTLLPIAWSDLWPSAWAHIPSLALVECCNSRRINSAAEAVKQPLPLLAFFMSFSYSFAFPESSSLLSSTQHAVKSTAFARLPLLPPLYLASFLISGNFNFPFDYSYFLGLHSDTSTVKSDNRVYILAAPKHPPVQSISGDQAICSVCVNHLRSLSAMYSTFLSFASLADLSVYCLGSVNWRHVILITNDIKSRLFLLAVVQQSALITAIAQTDALTYRLNRPIVCLCPLTLFSIISSIRQGL